MACPNYYNTYVVHITYAGKLLQWEQRAGMIFHAYDQESLNISHSKLIWNTGMQIPLQWVVGAQEPEMSQWLDSFTL